MPVIELGQQSSQQRAEERRAVPGVLSKEILKKDVLACSWEGNTLRPSSPTTGSFLVGAGIGSPLTLTTLLGWGVKKGADGLGMAGRWVRLQSRESLRTMD